MARLEVERFAVHMYMNWTVLAAADGIEEETKHLDAASKAVQGFVDSMRTQKDRVTDVLEAEHCLLRALNAAHTRIIDGRDPRYVSIGSTTLVCSQHVRIRA